MSLREKRLEKAEEEADKIWKQTYEPDAPKDEGIDTGKAPDTPAATETQPEKVIPDAVVVTSSETQVTTPDAAVVVDAQKTIPDDKKVDWEHKYRTLEGKYKAEVPRLSQEVKQWRESSTSLADRLLKLETELEDNKHQKKFAEQDTEIDTLATEYPEIGKVVKKLRDEHREELKALEKKFESGLNAQIGDVKTDITNSKHDRFDSHMKELGVPDWKEIDSSQEFIQWLGAPVPYANATKLELLQNASRQLDARTVSQFFLDFKSEKAKESSKNSGDNQDKLKPFVSPASTSGGNINISGKKPILTREQYTDFMRDSALGKFNPKKWDGKTEEQVEAEFDVAIAAHELK